MCCVQIALFLVRLGEVRGAYTGKGILINGGGGEEGRGGDGGGGVPALSPGQRAEVILSAGKCGGAG